nr:signal peptidase I [Cellulomonas fimi]
MWWLTRVRSHSMAPTLTDGQLVLTTSLRPAQAVRRGDLVVLDSPVEPDQQIVKRVVGLPGEKVTFDAGRVSIDDQPLPEPYASPSVFRGEYVVPPGHVLVLGDNRDASSDSRSWTHPYTPRAALRGRLVRGRRRRGARPAPPRRLLLLRVHEGSRTT